MSITIPVESDRAPADAPAPPGWRRHIRLARKDIAESLAIWPLWTMMANNDIMQRYRRSLIGPFWLTLSTGILIMALGLVYSYLFKMPIAEYLPYLTAGQLVWTLITGILSESGTVFTTADSHLKQVRIPKFALVLRLILRHLIIFAHNLVIYVVVCCIYPPHFSFAMLLFVPGLLLILIAGMSAACILSLVCTRFRDMPQVVTSLLQVLYFVTPVMWKTGQLQGARRLLIGLNPMAAFLDVARGPMLGESPQLLAWLTAVGLTALAAVAAFFFFARYRARVTYWL